MSSQIDDAVKHKPAPCRSCGALVYWLKHETTGRLAPINAAPSTEGNIEVDFGEMTYKITSVAPGLRTNHFSDCPNAKGHHKT